MPRRARCSFFVAFCTPWFQLITNNDRCLPCPIQFSLRQRYAVALRPGHPHRQDSRRSPLLRCESHCRESAYQRRQLPRCWFVVSLAIVCSVLRHGAAQQISVAASRTAVVTAGCTAVRARSGGAAGGGAAGGWPARALARQFSY